MANNTNDHDGGKGEFCLMCGRSDKQAGKMIALPGGLKVCQDCMNTTMQMMKNMGFDPNSFAAQFAGGNMTPDTGSKDNTNGQVKPEDVKTAEKGLSEGDNPETNPDEKKDEQHILTDRQVETSERTEEIKRN